MTPRPAPMQEADLRNLVLVHVAELLGCPPQDVRPSATLTELGLGSVQVLALCGDLEDDLDLSIDPAAMVDHPTLEALGSFLLELQSAARGAA